MELKPALGLSGYSMRDYLRTLFRRAPVILTLTSVVMAVVYIGLMLQTPYYTASVKMLISAKKIVESQFYTDLPGISNTEKITVTQSEIVKSSPVLERTVDALSLDMRPLDYEKLFASPLKKKLIERDMKGNIIFKLPAEQQRLIRKRIAVESLKRNIDIQPVRDTSTFLISVNDFNPVAAATIANTLSRSYVIFDLLQQLTEVQMKYGGKHPSVIQLRDHIQKMIRTLDGHPISDIDAIGPATVKIIEQASVPLRPEGKSKKMILIAALAMSLILGVLLAFTFEFLDPTFKTPQDTETAMNLPLIGSVPKSRGQREVFYHRLADQLYVMRDKNTKSIQITPVEESPKSGRIVADLARSIAGKSNQRVLVIDANFRAPSIYKEFKLEPTPGLSEVLAEGRPEMAGTVAAYQAPQLDVNMNERPGGPGYKMSPFSQRVMTAEQRTAEAPMPETVVKTKSLLQQAIRKVSPNLSVLPAGKNTQNPLALLDSPRMGELLAWARENYNFVLIHSSELIRFNDAVIVSGLVDGTVLVVDENRTRREVARAAIVPLEQKRANLIGAILNNRTFPIPKLIYERV